MKNLFTTWFRLNPEKKIEDALEVTKDWVINSPHNYFDERLAYIWPGLNLPIGNARVMCKGVQSDENEVVGVKYVHGVDNEVFTTDVIFARNSERFNTSVSISFDSPNPCIERDWGPENIKKPVLVEKLLDQLGGGDDGKFLSPQNLPFRTGTASPEDVGEIINGKTGNALPLIYVSKDYYNEAVIDTSELARRLYGEAHVLVESDREFAKELKEQTNERNAYNGAVGLYWPKRKGYQLILPKYMENDGVSHIEKEFRDIQSHFNLPHSLTWDGLEKRVRNQRYWELNEKIGQIESRKESEDRNKGVKEEVEEWTEIYEQEIEDKDERIKGLEEALSRAWYWQASGSEQSEIYINFGTDFTELYPKEVFQHVMDALKDRVQQLDSRTRKRFVIEEVIEKAGYIGEEEKNKFWDDFANELVNNPNDYKKILAKYGFKVERNGNHPFYYPKGDDRLKMPFPATPSDKKCGVENNITDAKKLFG